jgi:subtilisin family serine protease
MNIWLNQGEIPSNVAADLVDVDGDDRITFYDLNHEDNENLVSDINGNSYIDAGDLLNDPVWENRIDDDGNGFRDDLVGWDFEDWDNEPFDEHAFGHGTHVSGIIGAEGNNGIGIAGVTWKTSLMSVRVLDSTNRGSASTVIAGLEYATALRSQHNVPVRVINNSFSGTDFSQELEDSVGRGHFVGRCARKRRLLAPWNQPGCPASVSGCAHCRQYHYGGGHKSSE